MVKVLVKRLNSKVNLPEYKTSGSSGMDLMAFIDSPIKIAPNTLELVPTGLSIAIPEDLEIQISPRSGLAAKSSIGVLNAPGTIDSDYRGEVKVILINLGSERFKVSNKDRIAQAVVTIVQEVNFHDIGSKPLTPSMRGEGGFGSTGIN